MASHRNTRCPRRTALALAALVALVAAVVAAPAIASSPSRAAAAAAAKLDFGDAPDGASAGYSGSAQLADVVGRFPSKKSSDGASHREVGKLLLGARVTAEGDSQQIDRDPHDDGFSTIPLECQRTTYRFVVDASGLPGKLLRNGSAFVNVWADWNQDGDWRDRVSCGRPVPEWVITNRRLRLRSFAAHPLQELSIEAPAGATGSQLWLRASVSDRPFKQRIRVGGKRIRNDGRGSFTFGETEDYLGYVDGPADDVPPVNEFATCGPADVSLSHKQSPLTLTFSLFDLSTNPLAGLFNPLPADVVKDLSKNLPQGWKVNAPAGARAAALTFKDDAPERRQLGTLVFQVRSPTSGLIHVVSCRVEVVHENKKQRKKAAADYGDAPDDVNVGGTAFEPLCGFNVAAEFLCQYPSLAPRGPSHLKPEPIRLGASVSRERDSAQIDDDRFDDGFQVLDPQSCQPATFTWRIVVESPRAKGLSEADKELVRKLLKRLRKGTADIFLNAWFDAGNDGVWDGGLCQERSQDQILSVSDHAVSDSKLTKAEQRELARSPDGGSGRRALLVTRSGGVARVSPDGPGCVRGQISVDDRYHPDVSGHRSHPFSTHDTGGAGFDLFAPEADVLPGFPYLLGETEDYCNSLGGIHRPPDTPDNPDDPGGSDGPDDDPTGDDPTDDPGSGGPACADGQDNELEPDGKVDLDDFGCKDAADDSEEDRDELGAIACPGPGSTIKGFHDVKRPDGTTVERTRIQLTDSGTVLFTADGGGLNGPIPLSVCPGVTVNLYTGCDGAAPALDQKPLEHQFACRWYYEASNDGSGPAEHDVLRDMFVAWTP